MPVSFQKHLKRSLTKKNDKGEKYKEMLEKVLENIKSMENM